MIKKKAKIEIPQNGSKFIAPENVVVDRAYSITLNPSDNQYYNEEVHNRFNLWTASVYTFLKTLKYCDLYLFPEISGKGRLHMHGLIKIKLVAEFYAHDVARLQMFGNTEVDTVNDEAVWEKYCTKQVNVLRELTETNKFYDNLGCMKYSCSV